MFGIPEIQARLDQVEKMAKETMSNAERLSSVTSTQMERRLSDIGGALRLEINSTTLEILGARTSELLGHINAARSEAENRVTSLNQALVSYVDAKQALNEQSMATNFETTSSQLGSFRETLDNLRRRVEVASTSSRPATIDAAAGNSQTAAEPFIDDAFYVALENHFRGARDLISERQSTYMSRLSPVISAEHPLVDLGCGRGEWLRVLKSHSVPARGVDSNSVCILECRENELDVVQGDLLGFLRQQADASIGTYTLFQVLEHLPFNVLLETMREMKRTLVKGGQVIAEVPNAKNLRVASGTFWIDPTHNRPLYPEFLLFMAQEVGFASQDGLYVNDMSPELDLTGLPDGARIALERVLDALDTAGDFCLIATA